MKIYTLRKAVPCVSSPVTHVSLAFRARLCVNNEAPKEGADIIFMHSTTVISQFIH